MSLPDRMDESTNNGSRSGGVLRQLARLSFWAGIGAALVVALLTAHYHANGRYGFTHHWGVPDQVLSFGESKLYALMVLLGLPASLCFTRALLILPWHRWARASALHRAGKSLLLPSIWAALGSFLIAEFVIDWAYFTDDEQAYVFQAHLYAQGKLSAPIIEPEAAFAHSFVVPVQPVDGVRHWTGVYPVLQPVLMALSSFFGKLHWSQFIIVGVLTYNTGRFAQRWFREEAVGPSAAWLAAISPMLLGLGSTHHTAVLSATLSVIGARVLLWCLDKPGLGPGGCLGLLVGALMLTRPMEGTYAVLITGCVLLYAVVRAHRARDRAGVKAAWFCLLGYALGGLPPLLVFVSVNLQLTGHPLKGAYAILEERIGRFFGFGDNLMWGRSHSWTNGLIQTVTAWTRVNAFMFGWPVSLLLVVVSLFKPFRRGAVAILLVIEAIHVAGYFFLAFGSVHDFGHAYHVWHVPWVASISAWVLVRGWRAQPADGWGVVARRLAPFCAGMTLFAAAAFWPVQMVRWYDVANVVLGPLRAAKAAAGDTEAIVLWTYIQAPGTQRSWVFQAPAPVPGSQLLWARDNPAFYAAIRRDFPDREVFRLHWEAGIPVVKPADIEPPSPKATHPAPSRPR